MQTSSKHAKPLLMNANKFNQCQTCWFLQWDYWFKHISYQIYIYNTM